MSRQQTWLRRAAMGTTGKLWVPNQAGAYWVLWLGIGRSQRHLRNSLQPVVNFRFMTQPLSRGSIGGAAQDNLL